MDIFELKLQVTKRNRAWLQMTSLIIARLMSTVRKQAEEARKDLRGIVGTRAGRDRKAVRHRALIRISARYPAALVKSATSSSFQPLPRVNQRSQTGAVFSEGPSTLRAD
jgi:hypothetical protein